MNVFATLLITLCLCPVDDFDPFPEVPHREYYVSPSDPAFDCRFDGLQICGPGNNPKGFTPGYYGPIREETR